MPVEFQRFLAWISMCQFLRSIKYADWRNSTGSLLYFSDSPSEQTVALENPLALARALTTYWQNLAKSFQTPTPRMLMSHSLCVAFSLPFLSPSESLCFSARPIPAMPILQNNLTHSLLLPLDDLPSTIVRPITLREWLAHRVTASMVACAGQRIAPSLPF